MLVHSVQSTDIPNLATLTASQRARRTATVLTLLLLALGTAAYVSRDVATVPVPAVIAVQTALLCVAYLFTSYLLFSQFRSTGLLVLATAGAGYALIGLLQIPFLLSWPNLWVRGELIGTAATPAWIGLSWHLLFPILIGLHVTYDREFNAAVEDKDRAWIVRITVAVVCVVVTLVTLVAMGNTLPQVYESARFAWVTVAVGRIIIVTTTIAILAIVLRTRCRTILQLWMPVGLIGFGLDQFLYSSSNVRYSLTWYSAKAVALITAAIVLIVLLRQISALYRRVADLATIDQLTSLPNRRILDGQLDWIMHYGERHGMALAIVMVDVDYFKAYNDTYGHTAGDEVLQHVANTLQANVLRSSDLVARYGGEEFVALLPDATREGTTLAVERMRAAVERLSIPHMDSPRGRVTISAGAAVGIVGDIGPRELLRAADEALYSAKTGGRNRCVVVTCGPSASSRRLSLVDA